MLTRPVHPAFSGPVAQSVRPRPSFAARILLSPPPGDQVLFSARVRRPVEAPPSETFQVTRNNVTVNLRRWFPVSGQAPPDPQKPAVLLVHGLSGRSAWMAPLAEAVLKGSGAEVYGIDIPQVGQNPRPEESYKSTRELVDPVREAVAQLSETHGGQVHLVGLSLGGLLSARVAGERPDGLQSLTLLSPAFRPHPEKIGLKVYLRAIKGMLSEKLLRKDGAADVPIRDNPEMPAMPSGNGFTPLQRQVIKEKLTATDKVDKLDIGQYLKLFALMRRVRNQAVPNINVPVRIYGTENDDMVDVTAIREGFARMKQPDKRLTVFPRAWHDLVHDPVLPQIADDLNALIRNRSSAG